MPFPAGDLRLETARLLLRPPVIEDFEPYAAFAADAEASVHLGGPQPPSVAWRSFMAMAGAWHLQGYSMFSVVHRETGRWIGRIGPWMPAEWPGTEVGWSIVREEWNKGYATEAASAAVDWAFSALGWNEVIHVIGPANKASQAVARKLGARNRGPGRLPAPYDDARVDIWGQTREQWAARTRR